MERYIVCIIFINAWHPLQNSRINSVHTAHMNKRPTDGDVYKMKRNQQGYAIRPACIVSFVY